MKTLIITEKQFSFLKNSSEFIFESVVNDPVMIDTLKKYESKVINTKGEHYVYDDKDSGKPKKFVVLPKDKKGGILTIGYGHTGQFAKYGNKLSNSQAENVLRSDIAKEESKAKDIFPKFDSYPQYVQRALVNAVFRGEAKKSYEWVQEINANKWDSASKKYLEGWNVDFSKSNISGTVAERMVNNQKSFKKYAEEIKTKKPSTQSIIGKIIYPKKTSDSTYANVRTEPYVNNGWINNIIDDVYYPNPIGVVQSSKKGDDGKTWYLVKLDNNVSRVRTFGWVRSDVVSTSK